MTKTRKIVLPILAFFSAATLAVGGVSYALSQDKNKAVAETELPYNAVNIEDLLTTTENMSTELRYHRWAMEYLTTEGFELNTLNTTVHKGAVYTDKKSDIATDNADGSYIKNYNDYAGNLSFYCAETAVSLVTLKNTTKNDVLTFRTRYSATDPLTIFARYGVYSGNTAEGKSGYKTVLFDGDTAVSYSASYRAVGGSMQIHAAYGFDKASYSSTEIKDAYNEKNTSATIESLSALLTDGEVITVSYGVYDATTTIAGAEVTKPHVYLKIVEDSGKVLLEQTTVDTLAQSASEVTEEGGFYRAGDYNGSAASLKMFAFSNDRDGTRHNALMLAGVNAPIYATADGESSYTVEGEQPSGNAVSTVALPDGWQFVDGTEMIMPGVREYKAQNLAAEYYGNIPECTVTITGTEVVEYVNVEDFAKGKTYDEAFRFYSDNENYTGALNEVSEKSANGYYYSVYSTKASDTATDNQWIDDKGTTDDTSDDVTYIVNKNDYEGNLTFNTTKNANAVNAAVQMKGNENKDAILSFKTYFRGLTGDSISLYARRTNNCDTVDKAEGYRIRLFADWQEAVGFLGAEYSESEEKIVYGNTGLALENTTSSRSYAYRPADLATFYNEKNGTTYSNTDGILKTGDLLTISYGVYDVGEGENARTFIYLKIHNDTKGLTAVELTIEDTSPEERKDAEVGTDLYINIRASKNAITPFFLGGIDEPILAPAPVAVSGDYKEDQLYNSVGLPAGYTLKDDGATKLVPGINALNCTYTGEYYGKSYTKDCVVTVEATAVEKTVVTYQSANGTEIKTDRVNKGITYTIDYVAEGVIGFKMGDNFYPNGYSFTTGENVTITVVTYAFGMENGAAVRMISDEKGYGGLRFTASVSKADYEAYADKVAVKHAIIPTDMISGTFDYNETGAETIVLEKEQFIEDETNYELNFGVTDILYSNFAREFSGLTYIEVAYDNGGTARFVSSTYSTMSIYECARTTLQLHGDTYAEANVAYLNGYIDSVLAVKVAGTEVIEASGSDSNIFEIVGSSVENGTATVSFKVAEGKDFPAFLAEVEKNIPVAYAVNKDDFVRILPTSFEVNEGVYTITFGIPNQA